MPHYTTVYAIEGHYPDGALCYRYFAADSRTVDTMKEFLNCPAFRDVPPPTVRLLHYWEASQLAAAPLCF